MGDRDDAVARQKTDRRLQPDHQVVARRADDRAVRFAANGSGAQIQRRRDCRSRTRPADIKVKSVRVECETATRAPAVERREAAEVGPLGQIGLAKNDCARSAQFACNNRVRRHLAAFQGKGTGSRFHAADDRDVVLDQHGDPVQRTANHACAPLLVPERRDFDCTRIRLDHCANARIQALNSPQIAFCERAARKLAGSHEGLKLRNRLFEPDWNFVGRLGRSFKPCRESAYQEPRAACRARA